MPVRIFIKRHIKEGRVAEAIKLLSEFRSQAARQKGYVSGETLLNHYDANRVTVISTWQHVEDWIEWQNSGARDENEFRLEEFLDQPTEYEVYDVYRPED